METEPGREHAVPVVLHVRRRRVRGDVHAPIPDVVAGVIDWVVVCIPGDDVEGSLDVDGALKGVQHCVGPH